MRIFWILSALLIPSFQADLKKFHIVESPSIHEVLLDILRVTGTNDVILMIYDSFDFEKSVVEEVSRTILRHYPTSVVYRNPWTVEPYHALLRGTSRSLIVHLYISQTVPDYFQTKTMVEITRSMILSEHCVKILLITVLNTSDNSMLDFLKYAWTDKLLDTTILELSGDNRSSLTVHQYNPFSEYYSRQPYVPGIVWFPNKLDNLYGFPLTIDVVSRPSHIIVERDSRGYPVRRLGPDAHILDIMMEKMNFSKIPYARHTEAIKLRVENRTIIGDLGSVQSGEVDLFATTMPYALSPAHVLLGHTRVIRFERWVVLIPLMYEDDNLDTHRLLVANAVNIIIVLVFWLTSVLLRFDRRIWDPIRIVGTIASISMPRLPVKTAERVVFYTLLVTASTFFSNVFVELTKIGLKAKRVVDYPTYTELEKANLTPIVTNLIYYLILSDRDDALGRLRDRALIWDNTDECPHYMMKHRNVSCFIEQSMAAVYYYRNLYKGEPPFKFTSLYFWIPPVGYSVPINSPYKETFSDFQAHLEQSGIREKFYDNFFAGIMGLTRAHQPLLQEDLHKMCMFQQNLVNIPIFGCGVAFVTFLVELFIAYGKSMLESRARRSERVFVPCVRSTAGRLDDSAQTRRREISECPARAPPKDRRSPRV